MLGTKGTLGGLEYWASWMEATLSGTLCVLVMTQAMKYDPLVAWFARKPGLKTVPPAEDVSFVRRVQVCVCWAFT
jgi:hypothetical protein